MDDGSILSGFIIIFLLFAAAYFAVCETAFASVSRSRLKVLSDRGDRRAEKALYVSENFDKAITTILILTNIVHLAAASYVTVIVTRKWGISALTLSTVLTTIAVFFVGEMLPKSIAKKYSERMALGAAASLCFFMRIFTPLSAVLTAIGSVLSRIFGGEPEVSVTEDELHDIIENMTDEGGLDDEQGELVKSALTFGEVTAESIVTARVDLCALDADTDPDMVMDKIKSIRHSRIPVYEGSIDNIIGILKIRSFITSYLKNGRNADLRSLLDEPYFVHSSTKIDELLTSMSSKKINMAIVTDNYGGTLGVVTVEDILEELVGEIWDEDDLVVEPCIKNPDGSYTFEASVDIEDAFDFMDYEDPDGFDFEHMLLGQWAYEHFDAIPMEGECFSYNGLDVTVSHIENHRIMSLLIRRPADGNKEGGDEE